MKRFYREVGVARVEDGHAVVLDGRPVTTPARRPLVLPTVALAEAIAAEWAAQGDAVRPEIMPLTRLATTAIDRVTGRRARVVDEIAAYAGTDLVCHRASGPAGLAARQAAGWQPLLDWLEECHGARLAVTEGVIAVDQPESAREALRRVVEAFDDFALAALHTIATACGSLVIALALAAGRVDADAAWGLSRIDEDFQSERWGEDAEAAKRSERLRDELHAAAHLLALSRA